MFETTRRIMEEWTPDYIRWQVQNKYGHLNNEQLLEVIAQLKLEYMKASIKHVQTRLKDTYVKSEKKKGLLFKLCRKWEEFKFNIKKVNVKDYQKEGIIDSLVKEDPWVHRDSYPSLDEQLSHTRKLIHDIVRR